MGLFRRKKKAENDRGLLPSPEPTDPVKRSSWKDYSTRQEDSDSNNISDTNTTLPIEIDDIIETIYSIRESIKIKKINNPDRDYLELEAEIIECCNKILNVDNDHLEAWNLKAIACEASDGINIASAPLQKYEDTIECEDNILRIAQKKYVKQKYVIFALFSKATRSDLLGRPVEAKKCLSEILRLDPQNKNAQDNLREIEMKIADKERAGGENVSSPIQPTSPALEQERSRTYDKAYSLMEKGKYQEALEYCEKIISTDNDNIWIWKAKGIIHSKMATRFRDDGDIKTRHLLKQIDCQDNVIRLSPNQYSVLGTPIVAWGMKGSALWRLQRYEDAKKCFLTALSLQPAIGFEESSRAAKEEARDGLRKIEKEIADKERIEKNNTISQESENNFCENCGNKLKQTTKFCGSCGNQV